MVQLVSETSHNVENKRSKNFDKTPNRRRKILRRKQHRGEAVSDLERESERVCYVSVVHSTVESIATMRPIVEILHHEHSCIDYD